MKDTQPAFPCTASNHIDQELSSKGMTLRDYFAAKAMQGMLAPRRNLSPDTLAHCAYQMADAMMEARKRLPKNY